MKPAQLFAVLLTCAGPAALACTLPERHGVSVGLNAERLTDIRARSATAANWLQQQVRGADWRAWRTQIVMHASPAPGSDRAAAEIALRFHRENMWLQPCGLKPGADNVYPAEINIRLNDVSVLTHVSEWVVEPEWFRVSSLESKQGFPLLAGRQRVLSEYGDGVFRRASRQQLSAALAMPLTEEEWRSLESQPILAWHVNLWKSRSPVPVLVLSVFINDEADTELVQALEQWLRQADVKDLVSLLNPALRQSA